MSSPKKHPYDPNSNSNAQIPESFQMKSEAEPSIKKHTDPGRKMWTQSSKMIVNIHPAPPHLPNILTPTTVLVLMRTNWTDFLRGKSRVDQVVTPAARPPNLYQLSRGTGGEIVRCKDWHGIGECKQGWSYAIDEWVGQLIRIEGITLCDLMERAIGEAERHAGSRGSFLDRNNVEHRGRHCELMSW
jgi:hypothetical protein